MIKFNRALARILLISFALTNMMIGSAAAIDTVQEVERVETQEIINSINADDNTQYIEPIRIDPNTNMLALDNDKILVAIEEYERKQEEKKAAEEAARLAAEEAARKKAEEAAKGTYIGTFRITHYCTGECCNGGYGNITALGGPIISGTTIAVDPRMIPLGSTVYIEGYGTRIAQDTGGAIKGNRIDIAVSSHSEAMRLGVKTLKVYIKS